MDQSLDQLPEEVAELLAQHEAEKILKLEAFSQMVAKKRDEAVSARASSGIETTWAEDDEHYLGIDNANRNGGQIKPSHPAGGFSPSRTKSDGRSTVFLNITRPYVDAIVARTCDILLPTDDKNWGMQPTPIPDLIKAKQDTTPLPQAAPPMGPQPSMPGAPLPQTPVAQAPATPPGMPPQAAMPPAPPAPPAPTVADLVKKVLDQARDACEAGERRISDWLAEGGYNAENRKVIFDAAKLGTGVLKGPFPERKRSTSVSRGPDGMEIAMAIGLNPASKRVDLWNFFPDPACGENIHDGNYCFERDYLTSKSLRDLKGTPGYITSAIDQVLEEGPNGESALGGNNPNRSRLNDKELFEVFYGYMSVERSDLEAAGVDVKHLKADSIYAIVTMVNKTIIKAVVNPLDSGEFPYDVMCWQRVAGQWAGLGVSRQIRATQQMLNAANRNMLDNAGLSGGPMLIVRQGMITPADGDWTLRPRKIFYTTADADVRTVNDAITAVNIPSMQSELMNIIQFAMKTAELVTGFPLLMQGQNSASAPDTYGGQILATNNASTVLRYIARVFDDSITVPHIKRYYEYLLMYGEDESEKGDFQIIARGSTALVEQEIHAQEMVQLIQMSGNPAFGLDPKRLMAEYFKSRRFDPRKFQYSEDELQKLQSQPPQPAVPVQVAQIRAEAMEKVAQIREQGAVEVVRTEAQLEIDAAQAGHISPQMATAQATVASAQIRAQAEMAKEQYRSDSELAYAEAQSRMAQVNDIANMRELELKKEIALLEYAAKRQLTLDQVKADLAKETIRSQTQKDLAAAKMQMDAHDYERDRQHDAIKTAENIRSNQETASEARRHEAEQRDKDRLQQMAIESKKLEKIGKKARDVPGKRQ